jgi:hypothetical protein
MPLISLSCSPEISRRSEAARICADPNRDNRTLVVAPDRLARRSDRQRGLAGAHEKVTADQQLDGRDGRDWRRFRAPPRPRGRRAVV